MRTVWSICVRPADSSLMWFSQHYTFWCTVYLSSSLCKVIVTLGQSSRVNEWVLVMSLGLCCPSWKVVPRGCELKGSESPWAGNAVIDLRVCGPNSTLLSWCVYVRICVYTCTCFCVIVCVSMCLLPWRRPAAHSSYINGCRHVILHISNSYGWKMEMKKAPETAFVTHHIWVCIFIYKCFKCLYFLFFRTAVNA